VTTDRRHVLDPFAFPSDTRGRYRLLVLAAVALCVGLSAVFQLQPLSRLVERTGEVLSRHSAHLARPGGELEIPVSDADVRRYAEAQRDMARELRALVPLALGVLAPSLLAVGLLLVLAALCYRSHPARLRRRHGCRPLRPGEAPAVSTFLHRFARRVGVRSDFSLECKPGVVGFDAHTFGLRHREVVVLMQDPRFLERTWDRPTQAVALHEIAHLLHDDTRDRERSLAVWLALAVLAGFALLLLLVRGSLLGAAVAAVWTVALLAAIVLLWRGLVRSRELYADWRVATWGMSDALLRRLRLAAAGGGPSVRSRLAAALGFHPSPAERLQTLAEPQRLFRLSGDLAFVTGALLSSITAFCSLLLVDLSLLVSLLLEDVFSRLLLRVVANSAGEERFQALIVSTVTVRIVVPWLLVCGFFVLVAFLCLRALGVQVQRAAVAELTFPPSRGWGYLRLLRPAFLFSLGFEAGLIVSPAALLLLLTPRIVPWLAVWLLVFTLLNWSWIAFLHAGSRLLMGAKAGPAPPVWTQRFLFAATVALMVVLYWPALLVRVLIYAAPWADRLPPAATLGAEPGIWLATVLVVPALLAFFFAFAVVLLWGFLLLVAAAIRLRRRLRCPSCGEPSPYRKALGRFCLACERPLAGWAYTESVSP